MDKMKKGRLCVAALGLSVVTLLGCKKDAPAPAAFDAKGFWSGALEQGLILSVLNRADGSSRIYLSINAGGDSASAYYKLDGLYGVKASEYRANYVDSLGTTKMRVQTDETSTNGMHGVLFFSFPNPTEITNAAFQFTMVRQ